MPRHSLDASSRYGPPRRPAKSLGHGEATAAQNAAENSHLALRLSRGRPCCGAVTFRSSAQPKIPHCNRRQTRKFFNVIHRPGGLTAPNGGIRSASSIGTVVRSSAAVVGQRSEKNVPWWAKYGSVPALRVNVPDVIDRSEPFHGWLLMR